MPAAPKAVPDKTPHVVLSPPELGLLLAALTRLAVAPPPDRREQALARIAAHLSAESVQVYTKRSDQLFFGRVAGWPVGGAADVVIPARLTLSDLAPVLGQGDALLLDPGDSFPAVPQAAVTVLPLKSEGVCIGVLHILHGPGTRHGAPGPVRHAGFAALGDLVQLLLRRPDPSAASGQDALTGLPDVRGFAAALALVRPEHGASVLILDIDNFRSIKTVLGRAVSDALLCAMAERLGDLLGQRATLARSDGDAFAVLLPGGAQAADRMARELRLAVARPFDLDEITVYVTVSIGISRLGSADEMPQVLVRQAEVASFAAKTAGGDRQARYTRTMDARISRRGEVVQALRHALRNDEFTLAFQPKFDISGAPLALRLAGAEALLRWDSLILGAVSPEEFIPIAEASGVITEIDAAVIAIFARQLGQWRRAGHTLPASMNLSPRSFDDATLASRMIDMLAREGVAPEGITVEITETSLISMSPAARANLDHFRAAGIALAVDDFGTGYSSLGYLQDLIVSEIKIDKRFVRPLPPAGAPCGTERILRTILALAKTLDLRVVAEGVEKPSQAAWLLREGCHIIQGYLGGRAVDPEAFEAQYLQG